MPGKTVPASPASPAAMPSKKAKKRVAEDEVEGMQVDDEVAAASPEKSKKKSKKDKKSKKKSKGEAAEEAAPAAGEGKSKLKKEKKAKKSKKRKTGDDDDAAPAPSGSDASSGSSPEAEEESTDADADVKQARKRRKVGDADGKAKEGKATATTAPPAAASEDGEEDGKSKTDFDNFRICEETKKLLRAKGRSELFPVQAETFDHVYDGKDIIVKARTGTGKTLSFALPTIERLKSSARAVQSKGPRVICMAPTRELARQVFTEFEHLCPRFKVACIYGGAPYETQERALRGGLDIAVGTPGRIKDFVNKGTLKLDAVEFVILDEADRMLEVGFAEDVDEILATAYSGERHPQTLLFSATVPPFVKQTAKKYMNESKVQIDMVGKAINQTSKGVEHLAIRCPWHERMSTIADVVQCYSGAHGRTMIFTATKKDANDLVLNSWIKQETQVMHGDVAQKQRELTLGAFRTGGFRCLVATDVAARGLDIPEVDLVVQCEPPSDVDSYIHRSGRTGRAGKTGTCICFYKPNQEYMLKLVERKAGIKFKRIGPPQPEDIIKASAKDAIEFLDKVPNKVLPLFHDAAKQLIETRGSSIDALAAALAHISGSTEIKTRSILGSATGFVTFILATEGVEIRSKGFVWSVLRRQLPENVVSAIKGMKLQKDSKGAVFDVPVESVEVIEKNWADSDTITLGQATELPELEADVNTYSNGGRHGGYGGRGGRGYRGGRFNSSRGSPRGGGRGRHGGFRR